MGGAETDDILDAERRARFSGRSLGCTMRWVEQTIEPETILAAA